MKLGKYKLIIIVLFLAFLVRLFPVNFPFFTSDEARLAYRGYSISHFGTDELGRKFPLIFNSMDDYQLPLTSYIEALGIGVFGKTDFGARIIFILLGVGVVFLIYKISEIFFKEKNAVMSSTILGAFSPGLIFFSKVPNEFIVLIFFILLLFYILTREKINKFYYFIVVIFLLLTSKYAFFILVPSIIYTIFAFNKNPSSKEGKIIFVFSILSSVFAFTYFFLIPQGTRSLVENNFPIFQDTTVKNGIEKLRGQGIIIGWPLLSDKFLFSKLHVLTAGILHWVSTMQLSVLFGQIDSSGKWGFMNMGFLPKIAIVPFLLGLIYLLRSDLNKLKTFFIFVIILTFPLIFMYPQVKPELILLSVPFLILIAGAGLARLNIFLKSIVLFLVIFEVLFNLTFVTSHIKNANTFRPGWVKEIAIDSYKFSNKENIAMSDDLTSDIVPFLLWYTNVPLNKKFSEESFPFKIRQTEISNVNIIGSENTFVDCDKENPISIIVSKRDLQKVPREIRSSANKSYKDSLGEDKGFLLPAIICIH